MQSVKLFTRTEQEIDDKKILFKTEFFKSSNHKPVTLILTSDDMLYKINVKSDKNQKRYMLHLTYEVRFSIRSEQAVQQQIKQMRGDQFHSQIYKFQLERDDTQVVEFYNFQFSSMYWFDHLRVRLHMLDYQLYYDIQKLIGKGTFASVYEARCKNDNHVFAAKAFLKKLAFEDPKGRAQIENEIRIMRKLNHPNLINLHEVFENKAQIYLIVDLARGGTLEYALKVFNAPVPFLSAKVIFRQIVEAVAYMHENGIMHRDLKPSNILFRDFIPMKKYGLVNTGQNVLLSDLGIASEIQEKLCIYQYCGTPGYMAPEVFETEHDDTKTYDEKCDVFSLGCILYYLLIGKQAFDKDKAKQSNIEMKFNWHQVEQDLNGSHSLTVLLQRMLSAVPSDRPSCREILDSKILGVEYGEDGIPLFRDFQRPKSSPPKRQFQEEKKQQQSRGSILNSKAIKVMPILEEKAEKKNSEKERLNKRNTHIDQTPQSQHQLQSQQTMQTPQSVGTPNVVRGQRRQSAVLVGTQSKEQLPKNK